MAKALSLPDLRRYAVARSLFEPQPLADALHVLGFVQADPIRAPARAQDLTLRHRVVDYHAGDLERRYPELPIEEDAFINYGFVTRQVFALMHPRTPRRRFSTAARRRAEALLAFVRERGEAHPRDVDLHFAHGSVRNYWGGSSNATTHLLDAMHYHGMLRVARRDNGIRIYAVRERAAADADEPVLGRQRLDTLVDIVVRKYAPLPAPSLLPTLRRLRYGAPQLAAQIPAAIARARKRFAHVHVDGIDWYWPGDEHPRAFALYEDAVRMVAPFDPVVWDRTRFELLWNWSYRFEAYMPVARRKLGYYALPLLWRDRIIGWANLAVRNARIESDIGFIAGRAPRERAFARELERELARVAAFLKV